MPEPIKVNQDQLDEIQSDLQMVFIEEKEPLFNPIATMRDEGLNEGANAATRSSVQTEIISRMNTDFML